MPELLDFGITGVPAVSFRMKCVSAVDLLAMKNFPEQPFFYLSPTGTLCAPLARPGEGRIHNNNLPPGPGFVRFARENKLCGSRP